MDIQRENKLIQEAFEIEADEIGFCLDQEWGDYDNPYENRDTALAFNLFKKGWKAQKVAVPEWNNYETKSPRIDGRYLIFIDGEQLCADFSVGFGFSSAEDGTAFIQELITHWAVPCVDPIEAES